MKRRAVSCLVGLVASYALFRFAAARSMFDTALAVVAAAIAGAVGAGAVRRRAVRALIGVALVGATVAGALVLHERLRGERRDDGPPPGTFPGLPPLELREAAVVGADGDVARVRAMGLSPSVASPSDLRTPRHVLENGRHADPQRPPVVRPWRFAVYADCRGGATAFARVREEAARRRVAFAMGIGDLVGMARGYQFEVLRDQWADAGVPAFFVPGNHDVDPFGSTVPYERVLGPTRWTFDADGVRFVALDSSPRRLDDAQVAWAEALLRDRPPEIRHVVVFCHDPVFPPTNRPEKGLPQDAPATRRLQAALEAAGATLFCGSYHAFDERVVGRVVQRVTGGAGSRLEGPGGHHLLVVTVADAGLSVEKVDVLAASDVSPAVDRLLVFRDEAAWVARGLPLVFAALWLALAFGLGGLLSAAMPPPRPTAPPPPLAPPGR